MEPKKTWRPSTHTHTHKISVFYNWNLPPMAPKTTWARIPPTSSDMTHLVQCIVSSFAGRPWVTISHRAAWYVWSTWTRQLGGGRFHDLEQPLLCEGREGGSGSFCEEAPPIFRLFGVFLDQGSCFKSLGLNPRSCRCFVTFVWKYDWNVWDLGGPRRCLDWWGWCLWKVSP